MHACAHAHTHTRTHAHARMRARLPFREVYSREINASMRKSIVEVDPFSSLTLHGGHRHHRAKRVSEYSRIRSGRYSIPDDHGTQPPR